MSKFPFKVGDRVRLEDEEGEVAFISSQYITLSTHRWPREGTMHGYQEVKYSFILINGQIWKKFD